MRPVRYTGLIREVTKKHIRRARVEEKKILLVDDGTERTGHRKSGLLAAGYEVIVVAKSNIPTLQANIRRYQPDILMLDDEHIIYLNDPNLDLAVIAA